MPILVGSHQQTLQSKHISHALLLFRSAARWKKKRIISLVLFDGIGRVERGRGQKFLKYPVRWQMKGLLGIE